MPPSPVLHERQTGPSLQYCSVGDGKILATRTELPSIGIGTFCSQQGEQGVGYEASVHARIIPDAQQNPGDEFEWLLVAPLQGEHVTKFEYYVVKAKARPDEKKAVLESVPVSSGYDWHKNVINIVANNDSDGAQLTTLLLERGDEGDGFTWRISAGGVPVRVAVDGEIKLHRKAKYSQEIKWANERRRTLFKRAGAFLLAHLFLTSGGIADRAVDMFDNPAVVVQEVSETMMSPHYLPSDILDGITLEDYPEGTIDELNADIEQENSSVAAAASRVAQTMEDLDAHRYTEIRQRAETYRSEHKDELMSEEQLADFSVRVENAETNDQVMTVLQDFMAFFEVEARFKDETDSYFERFEQRTNVERARQTARDIIDVFGILPKPMISGGDLKTIEVAGSINNTSGGVTTMGTYSSGEGVMTVPASSNIRDSVYKYLYPFPVSEDGSAQSVIGHELVHSNSELQSHNLFPDLNNDFFLSTIIHILRTRLANYPSTVSGYASTSGVENYAELGSGVITDRIDGLAHPDVGRLYHSQANKSLLVTLIDYETKYGDGFADYIVSANDRIMDRSALALSR